MEQFKLKMIRKCYQLKFLRFFSSTASNSSSSLKFHQLIRHEADKDLNISKFTHGSDYLYKVHEYEDSLLNSTDYTNSIHLNSTTTSFNNILNDHMNELFINNQVKRHEIFLSSTLKYIDTLSLADELLLKKIKIIY